MIINAETRGQQQTQNYDP